MAKRKYYLLEDQDDAIIVKKYIISEHEGKPDLAEIDFKVKYFICVVKKLGAYQIQEYVNEARSEKNLNRTIYFGAKKDTTITEISNTNYIEFLYAT